MWRSFRRAVLHPAIFGSILLGVMTGVFIRPAHADTSWICPVPEVSNGSCTCRASGCSLYGGEGPWVCAYATGPGCSCPPLEQCQEKLAD